MKFENIKNNEQAPCPKCIWYGWMKKNFKSIKE